MASSRTSVAALRAFDLSEFVATSTRAQKPSVSTRLGNLYRHGLPDGSDVPVPDFDALQDANAALLERSTENVRDKDQAHRINLVTLGRMRSDRRTLVGDLQKQHRGLRQAFTGTYGRKSLPLVGLDGPPETRMVAVREQMLELLERLREPRLSSQLPAPRNGLPALDLEALATALEGRIRELETLLEKIRRMRKRADASLVAKNRALEAHRRIYLNVARVQEALYRLVGFDDLAQRIRTTFRPTRKRKKKATEARAPRPEDRAPETRFQAESPPTAAAESPPAAAAESPPAPSAGSPPAATAESPPEPSAESPPAASTAVFPPVPSAAGSPPAPPAAESPPTPLAAESSPAPPAAESPPAPATEAAPVLAYAGDRRRSADPKPAPGPAADRRPGARERVPGRRGTQRSSKSTSALSPTWMPSAASTLSR